MASVDNRDLDRRDIGGWLPGCGDSFDNRLHAQEVADFTRLPLNPQRIAYFREYLRRYFNHSFVYGQGTEDILVLLKNNQKNGDWLDVGAGTSTLFWSLALGGAASVTCGDIVPEALKVLDEFRHAGGIPPCYIEAAAMMGADPTKLRARSLPCRYVVFDAHRAWPGHLLGKYQMITALGCFGTARGPAAYTTALAAARSFLKPEGVLMGCDWSRSLAFVASEGLDNRYMTRDFLTRAAHDAGFEVVQVEQYPIMGDPLYDHVVGYALRPTVTQHDRLGRISGRD
jgi:hypothetical protein